MGDHYYHTIEKKGMAEFRDRGSRFIALAFPLADTAAFKKEIALIKKEHPKAVHHCFAYRIGTDGLQSRISDDGEPSGSAGRPIMGQIDSRGLTNIGIVVVRYFGGTLLGIPGLIHAYKTAATLVLQTIPMVKRPVMVPCEIQFTYPLLNDVMQVLKQHHAAVLHQDAQLFCLYRVAVPLASYDAVCEAFSLLYEVEFRRLISQSQ